MKTTENVEEQRLLEEVLGKSTADAKRLKSSQDQAGSFQTFVLFVPEDLTAPQNNLKYCYAAASTSAMSDALSVLPTDKFSEEDVQTLMKYGFARENCIRELRLNNGDMKTTTAALFAKSLKF